MLGENGEKMWAHKFLLMTSSPVFHHVFSTAHNKEEMCFRITDISRATMHEIFRYAYSENYLLNHRNMLDILYAASKFKMTCLIEKVINFICNEGIFDHTVFKILEANSKANHMRTNMNCFEHIQKNYNTCFKTNDFKSVSLEMLRNVMQTCKMPKDVAIEAVKFWSLNPANDSEDLDEIFALISLKDDIVEEIASNDAQLNRSEEESVSSSRGESSGGNSRRRRYGKLKSPKQQNRGNPRSDQHPTRIFNNQQIQQQNLSYQQQQDNALVQPESYQRKPHFNFYVIGQPVGKTFKFANLDLRVLKPIQVTAIDFITDLSKGPDSEVEISISDVTGKRKNLFYSKIAIVEPFCRYVLPRACSVDPGSLLWIRIEFPAQNDRLCIDNHEAQTVSDRIELRKDYTGNSYAQIVSCVSFIDNELSN